MTQADLLRGMVVKSQSGFFTVATDQGEIICQIPGRLKKERQNSNIVAIGDRVTLSRLPDGSGTIESVAERQSVLSRARPSAEARNVLQDREQVLVANPDQVVFIFSIRKPAPSLRKLDRFLVVAEMNDLSALICVNKIDLAEPGEAEAKFELYARLGYTVLYTSASTGAGVDRLRDHLHGKLSLFAGSSGVGKSSLLNAVQPGLGQAVNEVSQATGKGHHTTRHSALFALDGGGFVADTPGIRSLALFDIESGEMDAYFRELAPLVADCRFSDCRHRQESGCAVLAAVAAGSVDPARYDSYLRLLEEHEALEQSAY